MLQIKGKKRKDPRGRNTGEERGTALKRGCPHQKKPARRDRPNRLDRKSYWQGYLKDKYPLYTASPKEVCGEA